MINWYVEVEMALWMHFKIDPFSLERNLSIQDYQFYVKTLLNKREQEQKSNSTNSNKLIKSLIAIRDILNFMSLPEK